LSILDCGLPIANLGGGSARPPESAM
jgi:hypothetical protein